MNIVIKKQFFITYSLEWAAGSIDLYVNTDKTEYMCFNQSGDISTLKWWAFETRGQVHLPSSVSSTEKDIKMHGQHSIGYQSYGSQAWPIE